MQAMHRRGIRQIARTTRMNAASRVVLPIGSLCVRWEGMGLPPLVGVDLRQRRRSLSRPAHPWLSTVCSVANPRDSYGYRCGLRLAAHPDPGPAASRRLIQRRPQATDIVEGNPRHRPQKGAATDARCLVAIGVMTKANVCYLSGLFELEMSVRVKLVETSRSASTGSA